MEKHKNEKKEIFKKFCNDNLSVVTTLNSYGILTLTMAVIAIVGLATATFPAILIGTMFLGISMSMLGLEIPTAIKQYKIAKEEYYHEKELLELKNSKMSLEAKEVKDKVVDIDLNETKVKVHRAKNTSKNVNKENNSTKELTK